MLICAFFNFVPGCVCSVQTLPAPQRAKHELWQPSVPKDYGRLVFIGEESIPPEQQNIPVNGGRRGKSPGHGDVSAQISRQPFNQLTHSFHAINPSARKSSFTQQTQISYFLRESRFEKLKYLILLRAWETHNRPRVLLVCACVLRMGKWMRKTWKSTLLYTKISRRKVRLGEIFCTKK